MEPEMFCAISDGPGSNTSVRMPMVEIFARTTSLPLFAAEFIAAHNYWKPFSMRLKESDVAAPSIAAPISASSFGSGEPARGSALLCERVGIAQRIKTARSYRVNHHKAI